MMKNRLREESLRRNSKKMKVMKMKQLSEEKKVKGKRRREYKMMK